MCPPKQPPVSDDSFDSRLSADEMSLFQLIRSQVEDVSTEKTKYWAQPLFVSDVIDETRLTIEDIYIEAMTLAAEIRIYRRQLDEKGRAELERIMDFCHDALREKLILSSLAKRVHAADGQQK